MTRLDSALLAAADIRPGALHPARAGLLLLKDGETQDAIQWPGAPARRLRRLAMGRVLLALGTGAEIRALALWLGRPSEGLSAGGPLAILPFDRLVRKSGARVPRRTSDPQDEAPIERCRSRVPLFQGLVAMLETEGLASWEEVARWLREKPEFDFSGRNFGRADLRALPEGPGVYRFYDEPGKLVYVGQSRRLRARVSSYFRPGLSPSHRQAKIAARAHSIEVIAEGSDLAAQVREASEIRRLRPSANRQRSVRERPLVPSWKGDRVVIVPGASGRRRDIFILRNGEVLDRRRMTPGRLTRRRAEALLGRYYFLEETPSVLPKADRARKRPRAGLSRRSAKEASRLLSSWLRRSCDRVLSFDPSDSAGLADAARRLVAYLEADPSEEMVFIR